MNRHLLLASLFGSASLPTAVMAAAQVPLDQADPAVVRESLPTAPAPAPAGASSRTEVESTPAQPAPAGATVTASGIAVEGGTLPGEAYSAAVRPFVGRPLSADDLRELARAVGAVARDRGYVLATAAVRPSPDSDGVLHIVLDEGRIDAVRLLGVRNAAADRILQRLVTGRPIMRDELERAILLAGDVPGISIKGSRFVREDGFGILIVEATEQRTSLYGQLDNRGSDAIGPVRSTFLGSLRNAVSAGDEASLIAAQTPFQPSEFLFLRGRYAAPAFADGGVVGVSGSFGRAHPGASLRRLNVIGHSYDLSLSYQRPLLRRRSGSLWANVELRGAKSDQALAGRPIRDDRMVTLAGTIAGDAQVADGDLHTEASLVWGLPLAGVTREGDRFASRNDGDARFALVHLASDWGREIAEGWSVRLAVEVQAATRPLLASMELGAGGPAFARAYEYGERTGDEGVLGSFELRRDVPLGGTGPFRRLQLYGFVDGGYVHNLRQGIGGGSLASAGGGARLNFRRIDVAFELAAPLNSDRFESGDRTPRFSARAAVRL